MADATINGEPVATTSSHEDSLKALGLDTPAGLARHAAQSAANAEICAQRGDERLAAVFRHEAEVSRRLAVKARVLASVPLYVRPPVAQAPRPRGAGRPRGARRAVTSRDGPSSDSSGESDLPALARLVRAIRRSLRWPS